MNILLFFKGFLIGAGLSFPVGPIGILCLRRMLIQGPVIGIASGLGAATADLIFASVALLGITFISSLMTTQFIVFKLLSSIFLCAIGTHIFLTKPPKTPTNLAHG
jgi:threonine/homoserine/homoserine lactone efflux protein